MRSFTLGGLASSQSRLIHAISAHNLMRSMPRFFPALQRRLTGVVIDRACGRSPASKTTLQHGCEQFPSFLFGRTTR